jgi:hypothetical protein
MWLALLNIASVILCVPRIYEILSILIKEQLNIPVGTIILVFTGVIICFLSIICNIIYVVVYIITRRERKRPLFPEYCPNYEIQKVELELCFKDRHTIRTKREIHFKVHSETLDELTQKMYWTGQMYEKSELETDSARRGYKLIETTRKTSPHIIKIELPEQLKRGDTGHYTMNTYVKDEHEQMIPYLAYLVKSKTAKLILKVVAPNGLINSARQAYSADMDRDIILCNPEEVKPDSAGDSQVFKWVVENPELLRCYYIEWEF